MLLSQTAFHSVVGEDPHHFLHDLSTQVLALSPPDSAASMETDRFKFACIIENASRCCLALNPDEDLTQMPDFFWLSHLVSSLSHFLWRIKIFSGRGVDIMTEKCEPQKVTRREMAPIELWEATVGP